MWCVFFFVVNMLRFVSTMMKEKPQWLKELDMEQNLTHNFVLVVLSSYLNNHVLLLRIPFWPCVLCNSGQNKLQLWGFWPQRCLPRCLNLLSVIELSDFVISYRQCTNKYFFSSVFFAGLCSHICASVSSLHLFNSHTWTVCLILISPLLQWQDFTPFTPAATAQPNWSCFQSYDGNL